MKSILKAIFIYLMMLPVIEAKAANIAVVAPKVGDMAKYGNELIDGVQIAVDIFNQNGGLLGEKIKLITIDDRCEDSFAVSAAQMMTLSSSQNDKLDLIIGPFCNNAFSQISSIYANGKIVRIIPMPLSAGDNNINESGLIKIGGLISDEARTFFDFYKNEMAGKNLAMVYDSSMPQTTETAFEVQELFRSQGVSNKLTLYDVNEYGKKYRQMAKEILLNNQMAYVLSSEKKISRLVQELQEGKPDITIVVNEYMANLHFFRELGNFVEGVYFLALKNLKDSPDFTEELVELRIKGKEPRGLGVYGYAAVKLWSQLVEKANSTKFDKVSKVIDGRQFFMPWGEVDFQLGNISKTAGYTIYQVKNGEYVQVN